MFAPNTHLDIAKEVVRLAEKRIDAQTQIISALAQRAGALASVLGTGAAALFAAELALLNQLKEPITGATIYWMMVAPGLAAFGCVLCGMAAGTSKFSLPGNMPRNWKENSKQDELAEALCGEAENYDRYIQQNNAVIAEHAQYLRWGLRCGAAVLAYIFLMAVLYTAGVNPIK